MHSFEMNLKSCSSQCLDPALPVSVVLLADLVHLDQTASPDHRVKKVAVENQVFLVTMVQLDHKELRDHLASVDQRDQQACPSVVSLVPLVTLVLEDLPAMVKTDEMANVVNLVHEVDSDHLVLKVPLVLLAFVILHNAIQNSQLT